MSDEPINEAEAKMKELVATTKKNFSVVDRLKNRGLRRATITLFLDEELGVQLGWAQDIRDRNGVILGREREGAVGELDKLKQDREDAARAFKAAQDAKVTLGEENALMETFNSDEFDAKIIVAEDRVEELKKKLIDDGLTVSLRAVPPIIQRDTQRLAKIKLGIKGKNTPENLQEDFNFTATAFLMTMMIQSIKDNVSGEVNDGVDFDDALSLIDLLPPGQWARLDAKMGEVQFTDAISREIESQEDFS